MLSRSSVPVFSGHPIKTILFSLWVPYPIINIPVIFGRSGGRIKKLVFIVDLREGGTKVKKKKKRMSKLNQLKRGEK